MKEIVISNEGRYGVPKTEALLLRDILSIGFRRRRLIALSFVGVLLGTLLAVLFYPNRYESQMKILVKRDRVDPLVSPEAASSQAFNAQPTEEQANSEVELLKSRDLLERVVAECGLLQKKEWPFSTPGAAPGKAAEQDTRMAKAVARLSKELRVDVIKKTNLISVRYASEDPVQAARVVRTLAQRYLEKHVAVHRPPGATEFFKQETSRYRKLLDDAEGRIADFTTKSSIVSAPSEKEAALQKSLEFNATLRQTRAAIAELTLRIQALKAEAAGVPARMTTQLRSAEDGKLLSELRENLLGLEHKRIDLLAKFEPGYRPVQQVNAQIETVKGAIETAEKARLREEVTDRNPTFDWIRQEQTRAEAELAGLEARAKVTATAAQEYEASAQSLHRAEMVQSDLLRTAKALESNYLLYQRKEEEARVSDALDQVRILNVAIAEAPGVPTVPVNHKAQVVLFGIMLAFVLSSGLALVAERLDPRFRTAAELEEELEIPVLAALPSGALPSSSRLGA